MAFFHSGYFHRGHLCSRLRSNRKFQPLSVWRCSSGTSTLEFALTYALLLGVILTVVHVGLLYNARLAVADAADVALEEYTLQGGTAQTSSTLARQIAFSAPLQDLEIELWQQGNEAFARITARSPQILPGLPVQVGATVSGPLERFTSEQERQR